HWCRTRRRPRNCRGDFAGDTRHAPPNRCRLEEKRVNWLLQIVSVTLFNLRTIPERKGAACAAAVGIAGVVWVFVGFLSIAEGFRAAMTVTGPNDVVIVLRSS